MVQKPKLLAEQLREAIKDSGMSANAIAAKADTHVPSITRFIKGERSISIDVAGKIAHALGFELRPKQ